MSIARVLAGVLLCTMRRGVDGAFELLSMGHCICNIAILEHGAIPVQCQEVAPEAIIGIVAFCPSHSDSCSHVVPLS